MKARLVRENVPTGKQEIIDYGWVNFDDLHRVKLLDPNGRPYEMHDSNSVYTTDLDLIRALTRHHGFSIGDPIDDLNDTDVQFATYKFRWVQNDGIVNGWFSEHSDFEFVVSKNCIGLFVKHNCTKPQTQSVSHGKPIGMGL